MEDYLREKRNELMWSLAKQGYNAAQIGKMFGLTRAASNDVIKTMPATWRSPWSKKR